MTYKSQSSAVLITGASGKLGRMIRAAWANRGGARAAYFTARDGSAEITLQDAGDLPPLPACDTVIALWGQASNDPDRAAQNVTLAHRTRAVAQACGARRVLHLSSAAVYGAGQGKREDTAPTPLNLYGRAKLEMEETVAQFSDDGAVHCCLRLANVVGADSLHAALGGACPATLTRYPDGHGPLRSYIAPGDLASSLSALCALPPETLPLRLNIAAPDPVYMEDLLTAARIPFGWTPVPASPTQVAVMDTSRLHALLPRLSLRRTAAQMIMDWQTLKGA